jgi:hypothetical protein
MTKVCAALCERAVSFGRFVEFPDRHLGLHEKEFYIGTDTQVIIHDEWTIVVKVQSSQVSRACKVRAFCAK